MKPCSDCGKTHPESNEKQRPAKGSDPWYRQDMRNILCDQCYLLRDNVVKNPNKGRNVHIECVKGKTAPRKNPKVWKELEFKKAVITEQGTVNNLPIVDLELEGTQGEKYFCTTSGRMILAIAEIIKDVNLRNHGEENL